MKSKVLGMKSEILPGRVAVCSAVGLLAAIMLAVEMFMQSKGASLCKTVTCDVIGDYTRFGETFILAAGIQFFLLIATAMFFVRRYAEAGWLSTAVSLLLVGAMASEGVLLGFQFFSLQSVCLLCAAVFVTICVLLALWSFAVRNSRLFLFGVAACLAGLVGMYTLNVAPGLGKGNVGLDPVYRQAGFTDSSVQKRRLTLITSMTCPHCSKVILQMARHADVLHDDLLAFAFIDSKDVPLQAVALFAANMDRTETVLPLLYAIKNGETGQSNSFHKPDAEQVDAVRKKNLHTSQFLQLMGLNGVPVLVADENSEQIRILVGVEAILQYLHIVPDNQ